MMLMNHLVLLPEVSVSQPSTLGHMTLEALDILSLNTPDGRSVIIFLLNWTKRIILSNINYLQQNKTYLYYP